jgi:hypothetical protein
MQGSKKGNYTKAESPTRHTGLTSDEGHQEIACLQMQLYSAHRVPGKFALSKISSFIRYCLSITCLLSQEALALLDLVV